MSLYDKIQSIQDENSISLHVPGHHNNTIGYLKEMNLGMDMTEITGLDDLHQPEEVIRESLMKMDRYPNHDARYLVNGTTVGILSVIYAVKHLDGDILIPRNAHKSIYNALSLTNQKAIWMPMTVSEETGQYDGVKSLDTLDLSNVKLAIFTYPNYYGEVFDVQSHIQLLKAYGVPTLVDEAHGAHFGISSYFPQSSIMYEADIVVQSYHKTLPALTMGSVMYIRKELPIQQRIEEYLTMLQTSSPSYLIMTSLEKAELFYKHYNDKLFKRLRMILIQTLKEVGLEVGSLADPLKLLVSHEKMTGEQVKQIFEQSNIYVELNDEKYILLVLPLWHEGDSFPFEVLINKIKSLKLDYYYQVRGRAKFDLPVTSGVYVPIEVKDAITIDLIDAVNKISAVDVIPYPPGIPVILKGEYIKGDVLNSLLHWIDSGGRVEGIINKQIKIKDEH